MSVLDFICFCYESSLVFGNFLLIIVEFEMVRICRCELIVFVKIKFTYNKIPYRTVEKN